MLKNTMPENRLIVAWDQNGGERIDHKGSKLIFWRWYKHSISWLWLLDHTHIVFKTNFKFKMDVSLYVNYTFKINF